MNKLFSVLYILVAVIDLIPQEYSIHLFSFQEVTHYETENKFMNDKLIFQRHCEKLVIVFKQQLLLDSISFCLQELAEGNKVYAWDCQSLMMTILMSTVKCTLDYCFNAE